MTDPLGTTPAQTGIDGQPWLLLIHQIPPKPDYFRVKVGRRLQRVGAVAIKNSVYVLPATDPAMEEFQWVLREITGGGGEAWICRAAFVAGLTNGQVVALFQRARAEVYDELTAAVRGALDAVPAGSRVTDERRTQLEGELARHRQRFAAVIRVDFFPGPSTGAARAALDTMEARLRASRAGRLENGGGGRRCAAGLG